MAKFSLDDILAEVDSKRGHSPEVHESDEDVDDILKSILGDEKGEKSPKNAKGGKSPKSARGEKGAKAEKDEKSEKAGKLTFSGVTQEDKRRAAEQKRQAELEEKRKAAEQKRLEELAKKQREAEERRIKEEERAKKLAAEQEQRRKAAEEAARQKAEEAAEKQRQAELALRKAAEEAAERKRLAEEAEQKRAEEAARIAALDESERKKAEKLAEEKRRKEEESERRFATKNIVFEDVPLEMPKSEPEEEKPKAAPATTEEIELEKTLRQQKIEIDSQKLLIKESELEAPEDFLSSMNPYEFGSNTGLTQMIETIPAEQLAGDTIGVAGNELKELARASAKADERSFEAIVDGSTTVMPDITHKPAEVGINPDKTLVLSDDVKPYVPKGQEPAHKATPEEEKLLSSINKTIEQKRLSDIRDRNSLPPGTGPIENITIPTRGVEIDILGSTMPRAGQVPVTDPVVAEQKIKELASKRKRRISNFVLEDIGDEDFGYDEEEEEEFDAEDDSGQIWLDLTETHKSLRLRFILLLIITLFLGVVTLIQEFGPQIQFSLFGAEINFLDKRYDTEGFVFMNLICGVAGVALCSSVVLNGFLKLFKGKSDCDSVCAVVCVLSLVGAVLHLTNTDYLQRSRAFLYIAPALAGLVFNTLGKLSMIVRAKKNFRFISSEANKYYADIVDGQSEASALTKGVVSELPYPAVLRKTEILTDFLRKSYCEDKADRISRTLTPLSLIIGVIAGLLVYLIPNGIEGMEANVYWASSVFIGIVCVMSPFSMMFLVNNPFRRASKVLAKNGCALLGYTSAEEFGGVNAVITDASALFPKSAIECTNLKPCKLQNSFNNISLDQSIILAASLAIKSGSLLSGLFFDMIGGNKELLADIDGCVYEDNMGIMGWYGNKRLIMGNREHMKHHSIKVPEMSAIAKYSRNGSDSVYLAVGGELVIIFFIRLTANPKIRNNLRELSDREVSLVVKTTDSLVTVGKIADLFDIDPEKIKVISSNLHGVFTECTKYTSRGSGALSCNGSFVSLAKGILASKKLLKDINLSQMIMVAGVFLGALLLVFLAFSVKTFAFSPAVFICYNIFWLLIMLFAQCFRRY
ncbi:MAG: hypothetical protein ACI4KR_08340 [Ruminiclostridium sp.]